MNIASIFVCTKFIQNNSTIEKLEMDLHMLLGTCPIVFMFKLEAYNNMDLWNFLCKKMQVDAIKFASLLSSVKLERLKRFLPSLRTQMCNLSDQAVPILTNAAKNPEALAVTKYIIEEFKIPVPKQHLKEWIEQVIRADNEQLVEYVLQNTEHTEWHAHLLDGKLLQRFDLLYKMLGESLIEYRNKESQSILFCSSLKPEIYAKILPFFQAQINSKDATGSVPLLQNVSVENVIALVKAGANINVQDNNGKSLFLTTFYCYSDVLQLMKLFKFQINFFLKNADQQNIMHFHEMKLVDEIPELIPLLLQPCSRNEYPFAKFANIGLLEHVIRIFPNLWQIEFGNCNVDALCIIALQCNCATTMQAFKQCTSSHVKENYPCALHFAFAQGAFANCDPLELIATTQAKSMLNHIAIVNNVPSTPFMIAMKHCNNQTAISTIKAFTNFGGHGYANWNFYMDMFDKMDYLTLYNEVPLPKKDLVYALASVLHWDVQFEKFIKYVDQKQPSPSWMYYMSRCTGLFSAIANHSHHMLQYMLSNYGANQADALMLYIGQHLWNQKH